MYQSFDTEVCNFKNLHLIIFWLWNFRFLQKVLCEDVQLYPDADWLLFAFHTCSDVSWSTFNLNMKHKCKCWFSWTPSWTTTHSMIGQNGAVMSSLLPVWVSGCAVSSRGRAGPGSVHCCHVSTPILHSSRPPWPRGHDLRISRTDGDKHGCRSEDE